MTAPDSSPAPRCLAVVASSYLIQGIVAGVGVLMLGRLAQLGTPLETQVGLLASGALPWLLKFALALLLDLGPSWPLRARGLVISALQICMAVCLWGLASAWTGGEGPAPASIMALAAGWICLNLCAATQDVIVDSLALDTLAGRQAWTGTLMGLGHALGGGVLGSVLIARRIVAEGMPAGLTLPVAWVAGLALLPAALLWIPGRPENARARAPRGGALTPRERATLLALPALYVLVTFAPDATSAASFEFLFQHLGWDYPSYAGQLMPLAAAAGVLGALVIGPAIVKLGPARAAVVASVALGVVWLGFAGLSAQWSNRALILALASCEGLIQSALIVALHALALVVSARSPAPTTTFVLAMAALNLPRVLAPLAVPSLLELGFVALFVVCGAAQLLAGAGLWPLRASGSSPDATRPPTV